MDRVEKERELARTLARIVKLDKEYDLRYRLIMVAIGQASALGYPVGFGIDTKIEETLNGQYPMVVYIELPTFGQISWHLPMHPYKFDGHSTADKHQRISSYWEMVWADAQMAPPPAPFVIKPGALDIKDYLPRNEFE